MDPSGKIAGVQCDKSGSDGVRGRPVGAGGVNLPFRIEHLGMGAPRGGDLIQFGESVRRTAQFQPPDGCPEGVGFGMRHVHVGNLAERPASDKPSDVSLAAARIE